MHTLVLSLNVVTCLDTTLRMHALTYISLTHTDILSINLSISHPSLKMQLNLWLFYKEELIVHWWHTGQIWSPVKFNPHNLYDGLHLLLKRKEKKKEESVKELSLPQPVARKWGYGTWMVKTPCFLDMLAAITLHWLFLFNTFVPAHTCFSINKQTFTLHSNRL